MPTLRALMIELTVMALAGFVLAAIGPYGSFGIGSFAVRLGYWLPAAIGGYCIVRPFMALAALAQQRLDLPRAPLLAAAVLVSAAPATLFILWLNGSDLRRLPTAENWFQLYVQVAVIGGIITLLFALLERRSEAPDATVPTPISGDGQAAQPQASAFMARMPAHLREGLLALEMEDHYVRAHARGGSALILLRMRDAVSELGGRDGMQVHRSWWVARDAVQSVRQEGRKIILTLNNGIEAPVARNSVPALRAAGWL